MENSSSFDPNVDRTGGKQDDQGTAPLSATKHSGADEHFGGRHAATRPPVGTDGTRGAGQSCGSGPLAKAGDPADCGPHQAPHRGQSQGTGEGGVLFGNYSRAIEIKLPVYEGPLDLLLDLIKKNEMDIYHIELAEITRQYLDYLTEMRELKLEIAGEFLVMAATLIYIKSRMLLPNEGLGDEEEEGEDPRAELIRKLLEYQAFKEVARELGLLESERTKIFTRQMSDYIFQDLEAEPMELEGFSNNLYDLLQAFYKVLKSVDRGQVHEVFEQVISIEEKMEQIKAVLMIRKEVSFHELFEGVVTRNELVITFLAVLEIIRQRLARVFQREAFGEIQLVQGS